MIISLDIRRNEVNENNLRNRVIKGSYKKTCILSGHVY